MKERLPGKVSTEIITIRAAPLTLISRLNQSSGTWSRVTGEVLHSSALGFPPLPSNSALPDADNFAEFICDRRCSWFLFRNDTVNPPDIQKAHALKLRWLERVEVRSCAPVWRWSDAGAVRLCAHWWIWFLYPVREAFLLCGGDSCQSGTI